MGGLGLRVDFILYHRGFGDESVRAFAKFWQLVAWLAVGCGWVWLWLWAPGCRMYMGSLDCGCGGWRLWLWAA